MALLSVIYIIYFPIRIALILKHGMKNRKLNDKEFRKKYCGIYEAYKEDAFRTVGFEVVVLVKKFLTAISLVFLGKYPLVQLISIIIYSVIYYFLLFT